MLGMSVVCILRNGSRCESWCATGSRCTTGSWCDGSNVTSIPELLCGPASDGRGVVLQMTHCLQKSWCSDPFLVQAVIQTQGFIQMFHHQLQLEILLLLNGKQSSPYKMINPIINNDHGNEVIILFFIQDVVVLLCATVLLQSLLAALPGLIGGDDNTQRNLKIQC